MRYLALVRLLFVQQYKYRESGKRKRAGTIVAFVLIAIAFLPLLISLATAAYYMGKLSQGNEYIACFLVLTCQGLVLMFGMHAIISNVFVIRDADKLMYLPIRPYVIFLAKLTVAYLNELITTAVCTLVLILPFGIGASASAAFYAMLPIALVLIPFLPLLIGCIVALPLSSIIAKLGKNGVVKTVLRVAVYLGVLALYMFFMYKLGMFTSTDNILDNPEVYIGDMLDSFVTRLQQVVVYFHSDYMLARSMLSATFVGWLQGAAVTIAENVLLLALVVAISLPFYKWIVAQSVEGGGGRISRAGKGDSVEVKQRSVVRELILTDLRRVSRDGQMGFQSFAGIVVMPLIVVIFYFMLGRADEGTTSFLEIMSISDMYRAIAPLVIVGYLSLLGVATNVLGLYPISRENKAIYMLKSLPVPFAKILLAKVLLSTAVMVVCDFLTCLLVVLLLQVDWYFGLAILATMALVSFGTMCIATLMDLKSPKLGWSNFNQNLKNAKNSWMAMLIGLLIMLSIGVLSAGFLVWYVAAKSALALILMWVTIVGCSAAFAAVSYKVMTSTAAKYFERIEV